jgi:hypothetical protein
VFQTLRRNKLHFTGDFVSSSRHKGVTWPLQGVTSNGLEHWNASVVRRVMPPIASTGGGLCPLAPRQLTS